MHRRNRSVPRSLVEHSLLLESKSNPVMRTFDYVDVLIVDSYVNGLLEWYELPEQRVLSYLKKRKISERILRREDLVEFDGACLGKREISGLVLSFRDPGLRYRVSIKNLIFSDSPEEWKRDAPSILEAHCHCDRSHYQSLVGLSKSGIAKEYATPFCKHEIASMFYLTRSGYYDYGIFDHSLKKGEVMEFTMDNFLENPRKSENELSEEIEGSFSYSEIYGDNFRVMIKGKLEIFGHE